MIQRCKVLYLLALLGCYPFTAQPPGGCGDGVLDAGEECDDGNIDDGDGCSADCLNEAVCGDGALATGEECDDGNTADGDGCSADCLNEAVCGDGVPDAGEECDDGNQNNNDGCSSACLVEFCGDGIVNLAEDCDDGPQNSDTAPDACRTDCTLARCGDNVIDSGEQCDPPDGGACQNDCLFSCQNNGDCQDQNACTINESCVNNSCVVDPIDTDDQDACTLDSCDPINGIAHDPVDVDDLDQCTIDSCDPPTGTISHDPINTDDQDACTLDSCDPQTGIAHDPIDPDDGEECTTDSCDPQTGVANDPVTDGTTCNIGGPRDICLAGACGASLCGDGFLDDAQNGGVEECDDGNQNNNDGCSSACLFEANVFVACDAGGGGDGSLGNPFDTLPEAVTGAVAGDVIMILPNTGTCTVGSGNIDKNLTIQGLADPLDPTAPARPTLDTGGAKAIDVNTSNVKVIVKDLIIAAGVAGGAVSLGAQNNLQVALLRVDVTNANTGNNDVAIDCNANNSGQLLVDQSVIHDSPGGGIRVRNDCELLASSSLFLRNGAGSSVRGAVGIEGAGTALLLASTFVGNASNNAGVLQCPAADRGLLHGSILNDDNDTPQFDAECDVTSTDTFGQTPPGGDNIDADPLFLDEANGDFHLDTAAPSPCIDAAVNPPQLVDLPFDPLALFGVDVLAHDFDGNPRLLGSAPDMGMFEEQ